MRIAYLILAHRSIAQLAFLIDALTYENQNYCFVHLDARLHASSASRQLNKITKSKNWQALKKRSVVNWGGFNMVEATLNLILEALNFNNTKFDYLSLHSGMDLPIKTNKQIEQYLNRHKGQQFIDFFELPNYNDWSGNGGLDRVNYYWFVDELGYAETNKLRLAQKENKMKKNWPKNINIIYGGSQWWTLTADCTEYIIHFIKKTPGFCHFFKYCNIPDELFFQTILLNSPYKNRVENNNLRLIDWKTGPQFPKTLDMNDLERLEQSDKLFARKFDEDTDAEIIKYFVEKLSK